MIVPSWLTKRPITDSVPAILYNFRNIYQEKYFGDISVDSLKDYYNRCIGGSFFKCLRVLGFYGVIFNGKLSSYTGTTEEHPEVFDVPQMYQQDKIGKYISDPTILSFLCSFEISHLGLIHGVPIRNFIKLTNQTQHSVEKMFCPPASITKVNGTFFIGANSIAHSPTLNTKDSSNGQYDGSYCSDGDQKPLLTQQLEDFDFSFRVKTCFKRANIIQLDDLICKTESELMSISHFGRTSLIEVKKFLSKKGLQLGSTVGTINDNESLDSKETIPSINVLNLSVRSTNCLIAAGISNIVELAEIRDNELLSLPNFGRKSLTEIKIKFKEFYENYPDKDLVFNPKNFSKKNDFSISTIDFESDSVLKKLSLALNDFPLGIRSRKCLFEGKVEFVWQLVQLTENDLLNTKNLGRKSLNEIKQIIRDIDLTFGQKFTEDQINKITLFKPVLDQVQIKKWLRRTAVELSNHPLDFLKENEKRVLHERIWQAGAKRRTLEEIALDTDVSRERIRQIEKKVLEKISQKFRRELIDFSIVIKEEFQNKGNVVDIRDIDIELTDLSATQKAIVSCLVGLSSEHFFIDWAYVLFSAKGEQLLDHICDDILTDIYRDSNEVFFSKTDLYDSVRRIANKNKIFVNEVIDGIILRFSETKKVNRSGNLFCIGKPKKIDQMVQAFKNFFPLGLDIHKRTDKLVECLKNFDEHSFENPSPRSIVGRLADHQDIFLWGRGFFVHRDNVSFDLNEVRSVSAWIIKRFKAGHSRFHVEIAFSFFKKKLQQCGVPNSYALYTLLRQVNNQRIGQRKYPTVVDLQSDTDINEGVFEELESFFITSGKEVPYEDLKEEFIVKRGWQEYRLSMNLGNIENVYPWRNRTYIHEDYLVIDEVKLDELFLNIKQKLQQIGGVYSLKGVKTDMGVLWEQACPGGTSRTVAKLIKVHGPDDLLVERYFVRLNDSSSEFLSASTEFEEFLLNSNQEITKSELEKEFREIRGWTEGQFNNGFYKANIIKTGSTTYIHPKTISWDSNLANQIKEILEEYLFERNQISLPYMLLEELIYEDILPDLPNDIFWTKELLVSVGKNFSEFLFFDGAYVAVENDFDIEDLDDMIGYLIGKTFKLGISKKVEVEKLLWREGILESGHRIPSDQFFDGSSIELYESSNEVGLSPVGIKRYGQHKNI